MCTPSVVSICVGNENFSVRRLIMAKRSKFSSLGKDEQSLLVHGANGASAAADVVATAHVAGTEAEAVGVAWTALVERRRPVVAASTI